MGDWKAFFENVGSANSDAGSLLVCESLKTHRLDSEYLEHGSGESQRTPKTPRASPGHVLKAIERTLRLYKRRPSTTACLVSLVECLKLLKEPISNLKDYDSALLGNLAIHVSNAFTLLLYYRRQNWIQKKLGKKTLVHKCGAITQSLDRCAQLLNLDAYLHERTTEMYTVSQTPVRKPIFIEIKLDDKGDDTMAMVKNMIKGGTSDVRFRQKSKYATKEFAPDNLFDFDTHLRRCKPGSVVDMCGKRIVGEGPLVIGTLGITILNGTLDVVKGIVVKANYVEFKDVNLSNTDEEASLKVNGGICKLLRCRLTSTQGTGLAIFGSGSSAVLTTCEIHNCRKNCIWVTHGGAVHLRRGCRIWGSKEYHGISIEKKGSTAKIVSARVYDNHQDGIFVSRGASVDIQHSEVYGSYKYHGLSVKKKKAKAKVLCSKLHSNAQAGIYVGVSGSVEVMNSEMYGSRRCSGMLMEGPSSFATMANCKLFDNRDSGMKIVNGKVDVEGCQFYGSKTQNGLSLSGPNCSFSAVSCVIYDNYENGVLASDGAHVKLEKTHIVGSKRSCGVLVSRGSCKANIVRCKIADLPQSALRVEDSSAEVTETELCKAESGVLVGGVHGEVKLNNCSFHSNRGTNVIQGHYAKALVNGEALDQCQWINEQSSMTDLSRVKVADKEDSGMWGRSKRMIRAESAPVGFPYNEVLRVGAKSAH